MTHSHTQWRSVLIEAICPFVTPFVVISLRPFICSRISTMQNVYKDIYRDFRHPELLLLMVSLLLLLLLLMMVWWLCDKDIGIVVHQHLTLKHSSDLEMTPLHTHQHPHIYWIFSHFIDVLTEPVTFIAEIW